MLSFENVFFRIFKSDVIPFASIVNEIIDLPCAVERIEIGAPSTKSLKAFYPS